MSKNATIIGANGIPMNMVGYMVPFAATDDDVVTIGEPRVRLTRPEFERAVVEDRATCVSEKSVRWSDVPSGEEGDSFLNMPLYIFYGNSQRLTQIGRIIGSNLNEAMGSIGESTSFPEHPEYTVRIVAKEPLERLLDSIWQSAISWLEAHITNALQRGMEYESNTESELVTKFACQIAYDKDSARHSLAFRGMDILGSKKSTSYVRWRDVMTQLWGLPSNEAYWEDQRASIRCAAIERISEDEFLRLRDELQRAQEAQREVLLPVVSLEGEESEVRGPRFVRGKNIKRIAAASSAALEMEEKSSFYLIEGCRYATTDVGKHIKTLFVKGKSEEFRRCGHYNLSVAARETARQILQRGVQRKVAALRMVEDVDFDSVVRVLLEDEPFG